MVFKGFKAKSLALSVATLALLFSTPSYAETLTSSDFMKASEGQRIWWMMGAFTSMGHLVAQTDEKRADCVWNWYFEDQDNKQALIEEKLRQFPDHSPSAVLIALMRKHCSI